MHVPQTDRRSDNPEGHVKAWFAILVALYPATLLAAVAIVVGPVLLTPPPWTWSGTLSPASVLLMAAILAAPISFVFSLLALPFVPLRRWIVGSRPPFLKPGYAAVAFYGPALLVLLEHGPWPTRDWGDAALYELIALVATLIYVPIAKHLGLFNPG